MNKTYVASPLNYTGNKYKLLPQILPLFPRDINIFVDLFGGSAVLTANIEAKTIVYNEYDTNVFNIIKGIYESHDNIIEDIDYYINYFKLSKTNKEGYLALREEWNKSLKKDWVRLYTLICHSFNNSIRFNSKGEFNMPFGERCFNDKLKTKLIEFRELIKGKKCCFYNKSFEKLTSNSKVNNNYFF